LTFKDEMIDTKADLYSHDISIQIYM